MQRTRSVGIDFFIYRTKYTAVYITEVQSTRSVGLAVPMSNTLHSRVYRLDARHTAVCIASMQDTRSCVLSLLYFPSFRLLLGSFLAPFIHSTPFHLKSSPPSFQHQIRSPIVRHVPFSAINKSHSPIIIKKRFRERKKSHDVGLAFVVQLLSPNTTPLTTRSNPTPHPTASPPTSPISFSATMLTYWLNRRRRRCLLLIICSPFLLPLLCFMFPIICAVELFFFVSRRRRKAADRSGERRRRSGEGAGELKLLQRYLEDQLLLVVEDRSSDEEDGVDVECFDSARPPLQ